MSLFKSLKSAKRRTKPYGRFVMQAEEKWEAAEYHLEQMRKSMLNDNGKIFIFNLDAFLSTSRSITFVLQKEFKSNPKFKCWYCKKQDEMRKDELMRFFTDMRDISIHEGSPQTQVVTTIGVVDTGSGYESGLSITKINADGTKEVVEFKLPDVKEKPIAETTPTTHCNYYFFNERSDNDVAKLCEQYLEKLFRLILEAKTILESQ